MWLRVYHALRIKDVTFYISVNKRQGAERV